MEQNSNIKILAQLNEEIGNLQLELQEKSNKFSDIFYPVVAQFLDEHLTLECNPHRCMGDCKIKHRVPLKTVVLYKNTIFVLLKNRSFNDLKDISEGSLEAEDVKFLPCWKNIPEEVYDRIIRQHICSKGYCCDMERRENGLSGVKYLISFDYSN